MKYTLFTRLFTIAIAYLLFFSCQQKSTSSITNVSPNSVDVVTNLNRPWGITFLDATTLLITERNGSLQYFKDGEKKVIDLPINIKAEGQGGLLDIEIAPDYSQSGYIYMTYSKKIDDAKSTTALVRFKLSNNQEAIDFEELFEALPYYENTFHFGSRIAFDEDGHIFMTLGDRYSYSSASEIPDPTQSFPQDLSKHWGKTIRLNLDGSIPNDNPFVNETDALKEIYSYGHRNPQGIFYDKTNNNLYINEHGAQGGDEVNLIQAGKNYGWPIITYGKDYNNESIGEGRKKEGLEQPLHYWDPSIAPSSMIIYRGNRYNFWKNQMLVSTLRNQTLHRLTWNGKTLVKEEQSFKQKFGRLRDVAVSPDDFIYLLIDSEEGKVIKLKP